MRDRAAQTSDVYRIAGSLWSVAARDREQSVARLATSGLDMLHWDTTDGRLARPGGFTAAEASTITAKSGMSAECHIMAEHSLDHVDPWTEFCERIVVHSESADWTKAIDRIVRRGRTPALAMSPGIEPETMPRGMSILCMTVAPGEAGTAFDDRAPGRVATLLDADPDRIVGIDGGVTDIWARCMLDAGVRWIVVGTDLFASGGQPRWEPLLRRQRATGSPRRQTSDEY